MLCIAVFGLVAPTVSRWPTSSAPPTGRIPRPDRSVMPPAGGAVPEGALPRLRGHRQGPRKGPRGVLGKGARPAARSSLRLAHPARSAPPARTGFKLRPSQPTIQYTRKQARKLERINAKLRRKCRYRTIQAAVNSSRNNDRIVIMPGVYTEPQSRAKPLNDPRCNPSLLQKDASGSPTPSYAYQASARTTRTWSTSRGARSSGSPPASPLHEPAGHPQAGARHVRALQPPDRGLGPQAHRRDPRRRARTTRARAPRPSRAATPSTWCCGWTAATASSGATS